MRGEGWTFAQMRAALDAHPAIAHVYEIVSEGDRDFVVMELVRGRPASELLRGGPLAAPEIARIGEQVASALANIIANTTNAHFSPVSAVSASVADLRRIIEEASGGRPFREIGIVVRGQALAGPNGIAGEWGHNPLPWAELDAGRKELHRNFEHASAETQLPERPDYEVPNRFLIKARREMANRE